MVLGIQNRVITENEAFEQRMEEETKASEVEAYLVCSRIARRLVWLEQTGQE